MWGESLPATCQIVMTPQLQGISVLRTAWNDFCLRSSRSSRFPGVLDSQVSKDTVVCLFGP